MTGYETVIGLETHIQLNTVTKIFCGCKADSWADQPNTNICPVCAGLPGTLPVLNRSAVEKAVLLAAALRATLRQHSFFDRKNYFYPDLPKGYQITQYDCALASGGYLDVPLPGAGVRRVKIIKLHLEEDAGKTKNVGPERYIDFNRCGVPLVELVTAPDLHTADEAAQYLIRLRQLLRWLGVSEADMERAQLRCDANVSIRPQGATHLNPKTEIKNVNSIEAVREAIEHEVQRQTRELDGGRQVQPWTLEWDEDQRVLRKMRVKETEADYRYFREPDLLPIHLTAAWRDAILAELPELPLDRRTRFMTSIGLPEYDADILTAERRLADYFEQAVNAYGGDPKRVSNWLMNDVLRLLNERGLTADQLRLSPAFLAATIQLVDSGVINSSTGKVLLEKIEASGEPPAVIVQSEGLAQISDDQTIRGVCAAVLADNPQQVASYRSGKLSLLGWFVGQVMTRMRGQADPVLARQILETLLPEG